MEYVLRIPEYATHILLFTNNALHYSHLTLNMNNEHICSLFNIFNRIIDISCNILNNM